MRAHPTVRVLAIAALVVAAWAAPAAADPPGPTDYQTHIVSVEPPTEAVTVESIAGDSFIRLTAAPGHRVEVPGYSTGDVYLRFGEDGVVEQNENSPSRWLNDDRYSDVEIPPTATADAEPDWRVVSTTGSYAWHDHRTHWMNQVKPPGAEPGDTVLEAVVPLTVDGEPVSVAVRSVLLPPPSPWPAAGGALAGVLGLLGAAAVGRRGSAAAGRLACSVTAGVAAASASLAGWLAYSSVPAETGPALSLWLLPALGLAAAAASAALARRPLSNPTWPILVGLAGFELVLWAWRDRAALTRSYLPTDAPFWFERATVAAAAVIGVGVAVMAVVALWADRQPARQAVPPA